MRLHLQRVDYLQMRVPLKMLVEGADLTDPVFAHQRNRVEVVHDAAREVGVLRHKVLHHLRVPARLDQDADRSSSIKSNSLSRSDTSKGNGPPAVLYEISVRVPGDLCCGRNDLRGLSCGK